MVNRLSLLLLVLALVLAAPLASAAPDVGEDPLPELSIDDVTVVEGDTGAVTASFTVALSAVSDQTVTVDFATADDTATAANDYLSTGDTLVFDPGQTTQSVSVSVNGDTLDEPDETYVVNLSNETNATIADGQGLGTITDDDLPPALSIDDVTVTEGSLGTTTAMFTVSLSAASGLPVSVDYATADGTATAPGDYLSAGDPLVFAPGETAKSVSITVNADMLDETNETFSVDLSNPTNATIADGAGVGTIIDDDGPSISIDDVTVSEGNAGTLTATFNATLSGQSPQVVSVQYGTANGTATAPGDYLAASGTLVFSEGQTAKSVSVTVNGDVLDEADDDTFFVDLSNPTNATIADAQGLGKITDDDPLPTLSAHDAVPKDEGDSGFANTKFTVSLNVPSGRSVSVDYLTASGTATAGSDYRTESGTLTFAAGETTQMLNVRVYGDTLAEADETYFVNLSSPVNATIADPQGLGTITNDDGPPPPPPPPPPGGWSCRATLLRSAATVARRSCTRSGASLAERWIRWSISEKLTSDCSVS
jgi:hypothetical protein